MRERWIPGLALATPLSILRIPAPSSAGKRPGLLSPALGAPAPDLALNGVDPRRRRPSEPLKLIFFPVPEGCSCPLLSEGVRFVSVRSPPHSPGSSPANRPPPRHPPPPSSSRSCPRSGRASSLLPLASLFAYAPPPGRNL